MRMLGRFMLCSDGGAAEGRHHEAPTVRRERRLRQVMAWASKANPDEGAEAGGESFRSFVSWRVDALCDAPPAANAVGGAVMRIQPSRACRYLHREPRASCRHCPPMARSSNRRSPV